MIINPIVSAKVTLFEQETLPVIIYSKKTIREIKDCIISNYGNIKYELPFINAVAVEVTARNIPNIARNKMIRLIDDDALVSKIGYIRTSSHEDLLGEISEETMYNTPIRKSGEMGTLKILPSDESDENVGVAVIDTGVAPHYDLVKPYNRLIAFKDFINNLALPYDDDGHGTHVAGIIAGNGYCSNLHIGVAPTANIIAVKALDKDGNGNTSDILASFQWVVNMKDRYNIKILNLSLGIPDEGDNENNPLVKGVRALTEKGIAVIVAAGNTGPGMKTINSPGNSPYAITVGAANTSNAHKGIIDIAKFSSRGPTNEGVLKPDLVAPGVDVFSLDCNDLRGYVSQSGTSMATPVVSGVAALLYSKKPELTPRQVKKILLYTAIPIERESKYAQGFGFVNEAFIKKALK